MKRWGLLAAAALLSIGTALAEEEPSRHIRTTISGEAYAVAVDADVYGEEQKAVQAYRVTTLDLGKNPEAHFDLALWFGADTLLEKIRLLRRELPEAVIVVSSILPAQDPAFEKSSKWRNIPEWSEAVGAACAENGIPFADNTEICQTYADLWQPDGIHVRPEFYPYWAANLILAGLDSPAEAEDATNETENDPA